ncbi:ankyrin repeat domain-containing protein [Silvibacterium sp.]|uniref:ankyrin repeat domain-containing protein n=1 Tax=Silvibacterium sp. TaxID=1964179 RepID=UPI0039E3C9F9
MSQQFLNLIRSGQTAEIASAVEAQPELARCRDAQGVSALMWSIYTQQPLIRDFLLTRIGPADVHEAAALGDCGRMYALISADAMAARAVSADGWPPLHLASAFATPQAVELLLEHGAHIHQVSHNALRNQALHACVALSQSAAVLRLLLEAGAPVNSTQAGGYTPLHQAASGGKGDFVTALLEYGADLSLLCHQGKTASDYAREHGHAEIVELLHRTASA